MLTLAAILVLTRQADVVLPRFFSDSMVLQRDKPISIWGKAAPGIKILVKLGSREVSTKSDAAGQWKVSLPSMPASGPFDLEINGKPRATDVMVGEVWLASGQSNMEWPVIASSDYQREAREVDKRVRMFTAEKVSSEQPQFDASGIWQVANSQSVGSFSGVGYAFARNLAEKLNVTVGVVHSSWGGTPAESWTKRTTLSANPMLRPIVDRYRKALPSFPTKKSAYDKSYVAWRQKVYLDDTGNEGALSGWVSTLHDDSNWETVTLPSLLGVGPNGVPYNGATWFRKVVDVPASWIGTPLVLELGAVDDFDDTYVNGNRVGSTGRDRPDYWRAPRLYRVAPGIVRPGRNVIAVRVFDWFTTGGFAGPAESMRLRRGGTIDEAIPLAGEWKMRIERAVDEPSPEVMASEPSRPFGPGHPGAPGGLFNGMIAPFSPMAIRGAIWYQGEANAGRAFQYRTLLPAMIQDWRAAFQQGDFPFYFVQLPNFMEPNVGTVESEWAELREAQLLTSKKVKNSGQAVTIDLGEAGNIHPKNKRDVGARLAALALRQTYGQNVPFSGPVFREARREANHIRLFFDNVGVGGLKSSDSRGLTGFSIAGADRVFVWADVKVSGPCLIVSSPQVPEPVAVRYGWSNNPDVNLTNGTGIPASPFRSDSWPGLTDKSR